MPEDFRQVKGPQGLIQFPASMSDEDVTSAMRKLYHSSPPLPEMGHYQAPDSVPTSVGSFSDQMYKAPSLSMPSASRPKIQMSREPVLGDYAATAINTLTGSSPGAETGLMNVGTEGVTGVRRMGTPGQRLSGAAQVIGAGGEALSPLMGPSLFKAPVELGVGLATGFGTSYGAEKATKALGGSSGAQELASQLGFWLPTGAGIAAGHFLNNTEPMTVPKPEEPLAKVQTEVSQVPLASREGTTQTTSTSSASEPSKTTPASSQTGESLLSAKELSKPYGPPKEDFHGNVPKENLGFNPNPVEDFGNKVRSEVERRMGGPLQRGQVEQRSENLDTKLTDVFAKSKSVGGAESVLFSRFKQELFPGQKELTNDQISQVNLKAKAWQESQRGSISLKPIPEKDIPSLNPLPRIANALDKVATLGGKLDRSVEEQQARMTTRDYIAGLALKHLQAEEKFKTMLESHDNDGKTEFKAFMDAGEGKPGAAFLKPEDQAVASELHNMFQERWEKVQKVTGSEKEGIDNYLSHLWKRPGQAKDALASLNLARSPIEGKAGFLKQRVYDYASEGLDKGLTPITFNPIRMQMTALFQLDKFLAAHELKDAYKDQGLVQWLKVSEPRPQGWQPLSDKIFQPKAFDKDAGGLIEYGKYYAPPDVAKIFNRYVTPGLQGDPTYNAIRNYGNFLNQMNLGVSGYHGVFITLVSSISDVALGIEKGINNKNIGGAKNILRGLVPGFSAAKDYDLGKSIQNEAIRPTGDTNLQSYVNDLVKSGARFAQDPFYEQQNVKGFFNTLKTGNPLKAIQSGVQTLSKPIMKYYVPRVKLGMAAHMMEAKMDYLGRQGISDPFTISSELSKIWDSVDNRAGQMVYDNLFWNRVAKDLSFLTIRAVGWDYGSGREYLGAAKDVLQQTSKVLRGERPVMTGRMAFTIATPIVVGTLGAVTTYFATGKPPQTMEDYFYPQSGRIGTNGKPERMSYPSYMKDAFAFAHSPAGTMINKLHPMFEQSAELYQNKDFYGTEIYGPGDPLYKRGLDVLGWYGKSFAPFSSKMGTQRAASGIPTLEAYGESFAGLQHAPRYITSSKAEDLTFELAKRQWQAGPLTKDVVQQRELFNKFQIQSRMGTLKTREVNEAEQSGKIRPTDVDKLYDDQGLSKFESEFKTLKLPQALQVMRIASKDERVQLQEILEDTFDKEIDNYPPEVQGEYMKQYNEYTK